jgi:hypothetical protein
MNIKILFFGSAAAFAAISTAHATDAVVADPDQSPLAQPASACDAYGTGFVAVPGTHTCVRASGQIRFEERFSNTGRSSNGRTTMDFETRSD